ncbi:hypothetical protein ACFXEL_29665 [Streptomyces sp. NPDC059382]|uniref:hypothetical protein n=1 Tax=Streptomyces sp. NPDC059382 TaxID=3346816 RepID=UPI0036C3D21A
MNPENTVVRLCAQGMTAEGEGRDSDAETLFRQAWEAATDDYEACVAAHYLARRQPTPEDTLHWNLACLAHADRVGDERVRAFYPSLHGAIGRAHLDLGRPDEARPHFEAAAERLSDLPPGAYADWLHLRIARGLRATFPEASDPLRPLLERLCSRTDLESLGVLLPPYLTSLGRPEDEARLTLALRMLHAERRLPVADQGALGELIGRRAAA